MALLNPRISLLKEHNKSILMSRLKRILFYISIFLLFPFIIKICFVPALLNSNISFSVWLANIVNAFFEPNIIVTFFAGLGGIIFGFIIEQRDKRNRFDSKVYKVIPYIIIELEKNKLSLQNVNNKDIVFYSEYYDMYSKDLSNWNAINVIPLVEIYGMLKLDKQIIKNKKQQIKTLIEDQLDLYAEWYIGNGPSRILPPRRARSFLNITIQKYKSHNNSELQEILAKWETKIKVMSIKFHEKYRDF